MRNITTIANKMKLLFDSEAAKADIDRTIKEASTTAPELMYVRWRELHEAMMMNLPEDMKQWTDTQFEIVSIFSTTPVEELKAEALSS